jgi:hypothetical protein
MTGDQFVAAGGDDQGSVIITGMMLFLDQVSSKSIDFVFFFSVMLSENSNTRVSLGATDVQMVLEMLWK